MSTVIQPGGIPGLGNNLNLDAFGRHRTSQPNVIVSTTNIHDGTPHLWQNALTSGGTATHNATKACAELRTTLASGSKVVRQTRFYAPYQPGRSLLLFSTFCLYDAQAGMRQRAGYFDANDGIFLQRDGAAVSLVRRTSTSGSPVEAETVLQANWACDPLDGTGPSAITLDLSKVQIMALDLEWLGVGSVRVGFVIDGQLVWAHQFNHANGTLQEVYMASGNLPWRFELENTAAVAAVGKIDQICLSVLLEGGEGGGFRRKRSLTSGNSKITVASGTEVPLLAYRLKSGFNKANLVPDFVAAVTEDGTKGWYVKIYAAPPGTVSGGSWSSASEAVEGQSSPTVPSLANARLIGASLSGSELRVGSLDINGLGTIGRNIDGSVDEVIITITSLTANADFWVAANYEEVY